MSFPVRKRLNLIEGLRISTVTLASFTLAARRYGVKWNVLNRPAGMTIALPKATGKNPEQRLYVGASFTGNCVIRVGAGLADVIQGIANVQTSTFQSAAGNNTVTLNGTTTGGLLGTYVILNDMGPGQWMAEINSIGSGTAATPFSTT